MTNAKESDFILLYEKIFSNKEVCQFLWGRSLNIKEAEKFFLKEFAFNSSLGFAPLLKRDSQTIIGYAGILPFNFYNYTLDKTTPLIDK